MSIDTYREEIDEIDKKILNLIKQRQDIVKSIQEIKEEKDIDFKDKDREEEIIESLLGNGVKKNLVREVWNAIFENSLER